MVQRFDFLFVGVVNAEQINMSKGMRSLKPRDSLTPGEGVRAMIDRITQR